MSSSYFWAAKDSSFLLRFDFSIFRCFFICCALSSRSWKEKKKSWNLEKNVEDWVSHLFQVLICPSLHIPRCHFRPLSSLRSRATAKLDNKAEIRYFHSLTNTLFEIFIFCPKIQLWFSEKIVQIEFLDKKLTFRIVWKAFCRSF